MTSRPETGNTGEVSISSPSGQAAPPEPAPRRWSATWPARRESVATARHWLRELCRERVCGDACDDAELLLSEVVGNAIQHAGTSVGTELCLEGTRLRLTVSDSSTRPVRPRPLDLMAEGGRGLQLVDLLSERWGVEADRQGKRVWFELG